MSSSIVIQRSVTFINNSKPAKFTTKDLDLDACYSADEIIVNVYFAALNPIDFILRQLASKWISPRKLKSYGLDYSGEVTRRGNKVDPKWQLHDRIHGYITHAFDDKGTLSDYVVFNLSNQKTTTLINNFDYLDDEIKSKFNNFNMNALYPLVFGTAYIAIFGNGQKWGSDSKILLHGASTAVANCIVQIAKKHFKVGTVVGVCNSNSFEYNK